MGSQEIGIASVGIAEVEVVVSGVVNARVENTPSSRRIPDGSERDCQVLITMVNYSRVGIVASAQHHRMKEGKSHVKAALVRSGARRVYFVVAILQLCLTNLFNSNGGTNQSSIADVVVASKILEAVSSIPFGLVLEDHCKAAGIDRAVLGNHGGVPGGEGRWELPEGIVTSQDSEGGQLALGDPEVQADHEDCNGQQCGFVHC